ncbi:MAG: DNA topoisomerase IV subunit A [Kiritimatiellae bacterium]|nr:DNA topoisomerase IV subunit A [Kiritimatiellia bacterium]
MSDDKNKEPPSILDDLDLFNYSNAKDDEQKASSQDDGELKVEEVVVEKKPSVLNDISNSYGMTGTGPLRNLMDENFLQYTGYVICSRAIPAIEDGLKPVQRRILHALFEKDDGRFTKVANVVGHTMQYHPHGDASIGDALVVLANKLWGKGYLIEGQGNFGNLFTGMPSAASRYIECRLTTLAKEEIFNKKTTRYIPSYDGRNLEPVLLPSKIPLLLMLGADGIAVGLSTAILPHNFVELLEAEIAIIRKESVTVYPDFQLGGIMDVSEYEDGKGKVKVRAVIENREKNKLVITQLPWGETTDSLIANIEDAIKKKKVMVRQIHDLTAQNVEIELVLSTGATQEKVKSALFAFTNCEKSISSRPIVLDEGRPREMTITQILKKNVERLMALTRQEFDIRLAELDDLFHARTLDRIFIEERIYKRIEEEKTHEGVFNAVIEGFKPFLKELRRNEISKDDVERLLAIPIRRISQFDINKNREDIKKIIQEEDEVRKNIAGIRGYVIKYLKGLIKTYGKDYPRATKISDGAFKQVDVRAITASELSIRYDKENMFVGTGLKSAGEELFKCSSLDKLLFVWKDGRYKMMTPPEKQFVDKNLLDVFVYNPEKDRDKEFTCVYEEPVYGFSYVKRFTFGGMIQNKEYRLAPEKGKILYFQAGAPENLYVKFKPAKNQRIHQQIFEMKQVTLRGASSKGLQMTTKAISRISPNKGSWWDDSESPSKGVLL